MKRSFLIRLKELLMSRSKKPWACFETSGISAEGRMEFSISWNDAFIANLTAQGFSAASDEEMVQNFFIAVRMLPEHLVEETPDENSVNSAEHPTLSNDANILRN